MAILYPIRISEQLRQHLKGLRKKRELTQSQLGQILGVSQARIAEIEANPGLVNLDQLLQIFSVLGATLALEELPLDAAVSELDPDDPAGLPHTLEPDHGLPTSMPASPVHLGHEPPLASDRSLKLRPKKGSW